MYRHMGKQIDEMYALNFKAEHLGQGAMASPLKRREMQQFIRGSSPERTGSAANRDRIALLKSRGERLATDLGRYVDLCVARVIVWRQLRREKKLRNDWR